MHLFLACRKWKHNFQLEKRKQSPNEIEIKYSKSEKERERYKLIFYKRNNGGNHNVL